MDVAPKFTIEGQPDLENALNLLGGLINENLNKKIEPTWPIAVDEDKDSVAITFEGDLSEIVAQATATTNNGLATTDTKPAYLPPLDLSGADAPPPNSFRVWVTYGAVNNIVLEDAGWQNYYDVTEKTYFYLKVDLFPNSDSLHVTGVSVVHSNDDTTYVNPRLEISDPRPSVWYLLIGTVHKFTDSEGNITFKNIGHLGSGSISMSEYIVRIARGTGNTTEVLKNISYIRLRS